MANRVLLGARGSDKGLFISASGVNVADTSSTTPLVFDSRAAMSLIVHSFGQGVLLPIRGMSSFQYDGITYTSDVAKITHGLNYSPAFMVRWCGGNKIGASGASSGGSGGVAQEVYKPYYFSALDQIDDGEEEEENIEEYEGTTGVTATAIVESGTHKLKLESNFDAPNASAVNGANNSVVAFYSYLVFTEPNFLNGESL
tara:strand:+ start:156 stop:755 length:600 start_codon:yes stop_codon:yes gene_type:complete